MKPGQLARPEATAVNMFCWQMFLQVAANCKTPSVSRRLRKPTTGFSFFHLSNLVRTADPHPLSLIRATPSQAVSPASQTHHFSFTAGIAKCLN